MADSNEVIADPRLEKRSRRHFSVAEKKRFLAEADALPYGEKGGWLRRKGLYAGQLSTWRKELAEHGQAGLAARKPGRKPADPRDKELERLKKANARLEQRAYVAEQLVDLQKKVLHLFDSDKDGSKS
jgi:transposase-like protein